MGAVGFLARKMTALHHPHLSHSLTAFLSLSELKITHAHIITSGHSADLFSISRLLASAAISVSAADLRYAETLFDSVDPKTLFMYNTMIRGFSQSDRPLEAILFYVGMLRARISPDRFTFPFAIRSCAVSNSIGLGRGLHCSCLKLGLDSDVFVVNNSITMYSSFGDMDSARALFEERSASVDVVSWTALIAGYSDSGDVDSARRLFDWMPERNTVSWNAMIAGYARVGSLEEAMRLFNAMPERDAASWGALVSGCAHCGRCAEALGFFEEMVRAGVRPNEPVLVSAISACAQTRALEKGEWIHSLISQENYEGRYALLSNLYATALRWDDVAMVRDLFKQRGKHKVPGNSIVET